MIEACGITRERNSLAIANRHGDYTEKVYKRGASAEARNSFEVREVEKCEAGEGTLEAAAAAARDESTS